MVGRHDRDQGIASQAKGLEAGGAGIAGMHHGDIDPARLQPRQRLPRDALGDQVEFQVGTVRVQKSQEVGQPMEPAVGRLRQAHEAPLIGGQRANLVLGADELIEGDLAGDQESLAGGRHAEPAPDPFEQRRAEAPLRLANSMGKGRLGQPQPRRRPAHRALLGHRVEHGEMANFQSWAHHPTYESIS